MERVHSVSTWCFRWTANMRYDNLEKFSYLQPDEIFKRPFRALYMGWAHIKHKLHLNFHVRLQIRVLEI